VQAEGSPAAELAAAAELALHRALLDRTAELARQRLPAALQQATPTLHIQHLPEEGSTAAQAAAGAGTEAAAVQAGTCPEPPVGGSANSSGKNCGSSRTGGDGSSSGSPSLQDLGLAPSAARKVAGGSSIVWVAPPSTAFKWKRQQQGGPPVLSGGAVEAVAGGTGLKIGAKKTKPGQAVHPSAQPSVCKAALFAAWQQLVASLKGLPAAPAVAATGAAGTPLDADTAPAATYRQAKQLAGAGYCAAWRRLLEPSSPLEGWIPKPPELEEFALPLTGSGRQ